MWKGSIREPAYARDAPRQTVSLTINSDLFARVKSLGINASRIAEDALAAELERRRRAEILAEVQADVRATQEYSRRHEEQGEYSEIVRRHFEELEKDDLPGGS
jgi:post-segregation antitoxin (ccd killing protein)